MTVKPYRYEVLRKLAQGGAIGVATQVEMPETAIDRSVMAVLAIVSTEDIDRSQDLVVTKGIGLVEHKRSPVGLLDHAEHWFLPTCKYETPEGEYTVKLMDGYATGRGFYDQHNEMSEQVFGLIDRGFLRGHSIGFRPLKAKKRQVWDEDGFVDEKARGLHIEECELLEISTTPIADNPKCVSVATEVLHKNRLNGRPLLDTIRKSLLPYASPLKRNQVVGGYSAPVTKSAPRQDDSHDYASGSLLALVALAGRLGGPDDDAVRRAMQLTVDGLEDGPDPDTLRGPTDPVFKSYAIWKAWQKVGAAGKSKSGQDKFKYRDDETGEVRVQISPPKTPSKRPKLKGKGEAKADEKPEVKQDEAATGELKTRETIRDAYNDLTLLKEFRDGLVEMPVLFRYVRRADPSITLEEFHAQLNALNQERKMEFHKLNEVVDAQDPELAISRDDKLYYYVKWPKEGQGDLSSPSTSKPSEKPASDTPGKPASKPTPRGGSVTPEKASEDALAAIKAHLEKPEGIRTGELQDVADSLLALKGEQLKDLARGLKTLVSGSKPVLAKRIADAMLRKAKGDPEAGKKPARKAPAKKEKPEVKAPEEKAEAKAPEAGQPATYSVFRGTGRGYSNDHGVAGKGEYWSANRQVAEAYAGRSGKVESGQISLARPLVMTYQQLNELQAGLYGKPLTGFEPDLSEKFDGWMREQGYDGAVLFEPEVSETEPQEVIKLASRGEDKPAKKEKPESKAPEENPATDEITTGHPAIDSAIAAAKTPAEKVNAIFDASSHFSDLAMVGHMPDPHSVMQHMVSAALEGQPASVVKEAAKAIGISSPKGDVRAQIAKQMHQRIQLAVRSHDSILGEEADQADAVRRLQKHGYDVGKGAAKGVSTPKFEPVKKKPEAGPKTPAGEGGHTYKEGDRNADGLVLRDGHWRREGEDADAGEGTPHPLDGMTTTEMIKELNRLGSSSTLTPAYVATQPKGYDHTDPWGLGRVPVPEDVAREAAPIVADTVARTVAGNGFATTKVSGIIKDLGERFGLDKLQAQALLVQMHQRGEIRLRPFTQAKSIIPHDEMPYAFPLNVEVMYYVAPGKNAPEPVASKPAAKAPAPEPEPAKPAPEPTPEPKSPAGPPAGAIEYHAEAHKALQELREAKAASYLPWLFGHNKDIARYEKTLADLEKQHPQLKANQPGYSGPDAQGRRWTDGRLDPAKKEPEKPREPAKAEHVPVAAKEPHATRRDDFLSRLPSAEYEPYADGWRTMVGDAEVRSLARSLEDHGIEKPPKHSDKYRGWAARHDELEGKLTGRLDTLGLSPEYLRMATVIPVREQSHKRAVASAVNSGKSVPADVLTDYPDLAPKQATTTPAPPPRAPEPARPSTSATPTHPQSPGGVLSALDKLKEGRFFNSVSLPALYDAVSPDGSMDVSEFHDALRHLAKHGAIELRPFTSPIPDLKRGNLGMMADQEIKYYVDPTGKQLPPEASQSPPPRASTAAARKDAVNLLHGSNPPKTLADLHARLSRSHQMTVGQFHAVVRDLNKAGLARLERHRGAPHQMTDSHLSMVTDEGVMSGIEGTGSATPEEVRAPLGAKPADAAALRRKVKPVATMTPAKLKAEALRMYNQATQRDITREQMEDVAAQLPALSKADLAEVATSIGLSASRISSLSREKAAKLIGQAITGRKAAHERAQLT